MTLDPATKRLKARAQRALGSQRVADAVVKVRAIVGPFEIPDQEPLAQKALDKMHDGEQPTAEEMTALDLSSEMLDRARRRSSPDGARHRVDRPPESARMFCGDERSRSNWCFDHNGELAERRDGRVALREGPNLRWCLRGKFRNESAACANPVRESSPPAPRLAEIRGDPRAEHGDGLAPGVERTVVRGAVDPLRQPRDNDDPRLRARRRQLARDPRAVRRHATRSDDAHRARCERRRFAVNP